MTDYKPLRTQEELDRELFIRDNRLYSSSDLSALLGDGVWEKKYVEVGQEVTPFMREVLLDLVSLGWLYSGGEE